MKESLIERRLWREIKKRDIEIGMLKSELDEKEFENVKLKEKIIYLNTLLKKK